MKLAFEVLAGFTIFVGWYTFWYNRYLDHDWPFLPCFVMAIGVPLAIAAAVMVKFV